MYRQPENSNRVKSMKNKFEGLNSPTNDKTKKSPIRNNANSSKPVNINGKIHDKVKQKHENNNNEYKNDKKSTISKDTQNLKIDSNKMKTDDKSKKDRFEDKNRINKDFSNVNKKELCNAPPLNLTRQLNDPSKKGCIKRTPAFRKDKIINNSRTKNSDDFANIVKIFESNDTETCDNVDSAEVKILTTNGINNRSDFKVSLISKQTVSISEAPKIHHIQKLTSSVSSSELPKNAIQKSEVQKQKLTTSSSLSILERKTNLVSELRQKSLSPVRKIEPSITNTSTLKMSEKENHSVPLVKELIQTLTNNEHRSLINELTTNINLPPYAQVVKPKKNTTGTGNTDVPLTDTLKAALKQPLPVGPPPKKPPRTFAHTPTKEESIINPLFCEKLNESLAQNLQKTPEDKKKIKSDPKLMLQKLENALLNNKIRSPKLPKKLKPESPKPSSSTQPNLYTVENSKNLFPNCLPSLNCVSRTSASNAYAKIVPKVGSMSTFFTDSKGEEPIYAEPFQHKEESPKSSKKVGFHRRGSHENKADTLTNSVHYMSNPVCDWSQSEALHASEEAVTVAKQNDVECNKREKNAGEIESGALTRTKLNLIMNQTYATPSPTDSDMESLPSTPSSDGTPQSLKRNTIKDLILSFEQKQQQLEPTSLNTPSQKQLTISSSWSPEQNRNSAVESELTVEEKKKLKTQLNRTLTERRKNYVRRVCSTLKKKLVPQEGSHLFECCLLVGLNVSDLTPYIKNKFPPDYEVPPWVEHLCFPDATEWSGKLTSPNVTSTDCQCYSLVITDEKGDRKYGYCRRVVPEEASVCLPLTYCIISTSRATGFYHKVLQELESRHGLPFGLQETFLKELYNCKFPQPGERIHVSCLLRSVVVNNCEEMLKKQQISTPENVECVKRLVNMQNGIYGCINKPKSDSDEETDFRTPKNTYATPNDEAFAKITKYSQEFRSRKCNSANNSSDSIDSIENLEIRPKNLESQNHSRNSEPQINRRMGQLFEDLDNKTNCTASDSKTSDSASPLLHLNNQLLHDSLLEDIVLIRPQDSRLEDADLTTLFNTLDLVTLLQTFGSLLHERKVIFVSACLSKVSSCVEALQSILYPFSWQHTFIPVLSNNMLDILSAPLPLIAGVLASHITETLIIEEGIAVNLDTSTVVCYMGDENDIIPKRLQKGLTASLQLVSETVASDERTKNVFVSDAFIRMFVEVCGCYKQFIVVKESGQRVFEKEAFLRDHPCKSKCVRLFLEWFTETAMFNHFIQLHLDAEQPDSMFDQMCADIAAAMQKNLKVTQKVKHFGHKLFH